MKKIFYNGKYLILFLFLCFTFATVAYAGLSTQLAITGEAKFRAKADIRVTDIELSSVDNGATLQYEPLYDVNSTTMGFILPNSNSSITYKVTVTNYGDIDQTIYSIITALSNNDSVNFSISGYEIKQVIDFQSTVSFYITFTTTSSSDQVINKRLEYEFRKVYKVYYDGEYENMPSTQIKYESEPLQLSDKIPKRKGYTFIGWSDSKEGETIKYHASDMYEIDKEIILYPKWETGKYVITLDNQEATTEGTEKVYLKYTDGVYIDEKLENKMTTKSNPIIVPKKTGYIFKGYYTKTGDTGVKVIDETGYITTEFTNTLFTEDSTIYARWTINKVHIRFSTNGGTIAQTTKSSDGKTTYTWTQDDNTNKGLISLSTNSGASSIYQEVVNYGSNQSSSGISNYNNGNYINITKTGYTGVSKQEWICLTGCTTANKKFDQSVVYNASDFCDASKADCTVVLGVNWTPKTYAITLDKQNGIGGTDTIYETYASKYSLTSNGVAMSTDTNPIEKPTREGYTFNGYYTETSGGVQYINANGYLTTNANTKNFTENGKLYARWTMNKVHIRFSTNGGTITQITSDTTRKWTQDNDTNNGLISLSTNGGTSSVYQQTVNYGAKLPSSGTPTGLPNYNSSSFMTIKKTGYSGVSDKEWKCLSENCKQDTYDHDVIYSASDFCDASKADCTVVLGVNWQINTITIKYNVNGGEIATQNNGLGTWSKNTSGTVLNNGTEFKYTNSYGLKLGSNGLPNYDNPDGINISKTGYKALANKEWICISKNCEGKTYDHAVVIYNMSDFCDASEKSCEVELGVNWTPKTYKITLTNTSATTTGTTSVTATYNSSTISPASITLPKRSYTVSNFGIDAARHSDGATVSSTSTLTSAYTFNGWYTATSNGSKVLSNAASPALQASVSGYTNASSQWVKDGDATLYAQWTSKTVTLPTITKTGYTCGWTTNASGTTIEHASGKSITPTANTTLYGVCTANTYTITLDKQNGTGGTNTIYETYGSKYSLTSNGVAMSTNANPIEKPTRVGYTFKGYYTQTSGGVQYINENGYLTSSANTKNFTENGKLYARWAINKVYVRFSTNGGTITSTTQTTDGKTTYTWTQNNDSNSGLISLSTNGGASSVYQQIINYGADLGSSGLSNYNNGNYISITKTGYSGASKKEWICLKDCTTANKTFDHSAVYNASDFCDASNGDCTVVLGVNWTPNTYTIGYTLNGGSNPSSKPTSGTYDSDVHITNPTKTFTVTINTNSQGATISATSASSTQTFAGWTSTTVGSNAKTGTAANPSTSWNGTTKTTNTYFKNLRESGTVTMVANWTAVNVTLPTITKTGYTCGYATSATGKSSYSSGGSYTPSTTAASATLYAVCTPNTYKIEYTLNGGSDPSSKPTSGTYDSDVHITNPTKTFKVTINANSQGATIKDSSGTAVTSASSTQTFAGWTSTTVGSNAKTGTAANPSTSWNGTTKTTNTYFKNLIESGTVTMVANWTAVNVTLPTITKTGYTCGYATSATGKSSYASGASYTPSTTTASATLYAVCTAKTYTITLTNTSATTTGTTSVTATYNSSAISPASITLPKRSYTVSNFGVAAARHSDGATVSSTSTLTSTYTFNGWYTAASNGSKVLSNAASPALQASVSGYTNASSQWIKDGAATLYAQWTSKAVTLPTITKTGYTCGWTTSTSGTTITYASGASYTPTANTTLYGVCTPKTYTITLNQNGATTNGTTSVTATYNSSTLSPASITLPKRSYTVSNFGLDATRKSNGATVSSTSTLTSTYTFNGWYTAASNGSKVLSNAASPALQASISGYTNASSQWIKDGAATLYAQWTSKAVTLPTITKTGYTCGWTTSTSGTTITYASGASYTPTANTTLYGVCTANTYTIGYTLNGGSDPSSKPTSGTYDSDVHITNPTKTFKVTINANSQDATISATSASSTQTFAGWTSTTVGSNAKTGTAANPTTAWNGTTKTTNAYFKNLRESGTVTMIANWTAVNVTLPTITKTGYTCGYATSASGSLTYASGAAYTPSTTTASATLYAVCTKNNYLVDSKYYTTLAQAVAAAKSSSTIKVVSSNTDNSSVTIGKNVNIDTNGYTITRNANSITINSGFTVSMIDTATTHGSISFTTGTIINSGTLNYNVLTINKSSSGCIIENKGTLNYNSGTLNLTYTGITNTYGIIYDTGSSITNIHGGTIKSSGAAHGIYHNSTGKLYMNGGTISVRGDGHCGIYSTTSATVEITAGSITSKGSTGYENHNKGIDMNSVSGNLIITGGSVTGDKYGIEAACSITIGDVSKAYSENAVVITGNVYSLSIESPEDVTVTFNNGKLISGSTAPYSGLVETTRSGYVLSSTKSGSTYTTVLKAKQNIKITVTPTSISGVKGGSNTTIKITTNVAATCTFNGNSLPVTLQVGSTTGRSIKVSTTANTAATVYAHWSGTISAGNAISYSCVPASSEYLTSGGAITVTP